MRTRRASHLLARFAFAVPAILLLGSAPVASAGFLDHLTIRNTFDPQVTARPAQVNASQIVGSDAQYLINAAVKYQLTGGLFDLGPYIEWQRVTDPKQPQDLRKLGLAGEWQVRDLTTGDHNWTPLLGTQLSGKSDQIKKQDGGLATLSLSALAIGDAGKLRSFWRPGVTTETGVFAFSYEPKFVFEWDIRDGAHPVFRAAPALQAQIYPLPLACDYRLQFTFDGILRYSSRDEGKDLDRRHGKVDIGLNIFLLRQESESEPNRAAGLSFLYSHGSDPANSLDERELRSIAFSLLY